MHKYVVKFLQGYPLKTFFPIINNIEIFFSTLQPKISNQGLGVLPYVDIHFFNWGDKRKKCYSLDVGRGFKDKKSKVKNKL